MTAAMTDSERALWVQAKLDYEHALAISRSAWAAEFTDIKTFPLDTIQAGAATVLIHITKLRGEERLHVRVPPQAAPAAVKRDATSPAPSQAPVAVPPCPQCGGAMWDNRVGKKNPKGPDFKCKDKECKDEKGFGTALWLKDLKKVAKPVPAGSFDDLPEALAEVDDLPF